MLLSIAALFEFNVWSQDVIQAYVQAAEKIMGEIYIIPTKDFKLSKDVLLKLLKPLYGLCDSGDSWHSTFTQHLKDDLLMTPTLSDSELFFKVINGEISGLIGTYVDDSISAGNKTFEECSTITGKMFESKGRQYHNFKFAGMEIETIEGTGYKIHQKSFAEKISTLPNDSCFSEFRSKRQELAWLVNTRPDLACAVNLAAQVTETSFSEGDITAINKIVLASKKHSHRGLLQQKLDINTLKIVVYTDAAFSYTYVVLITNLNCDILYYYVMGQTNATFYIIQVRNPNE